MDNLGVNSKVRLEMTAEEWCYVAAACGTLIYDRMQEGDVNSVLILNKFMMIAMDLTKNNKLHEN